jgi:hypothetical protein
MKTQYIQFSKLWNSRASDYNRTRQKGTEALIFNGYRDWLSPEGRRLNNYLSK